MKTKLIGLLTIILLSACNNKKTEYIPIDAFKSSYQALQGANGKNYDIEETVRILNGIELAQAKSENFDDFLKYMARQDYSKVAQDVIDLRMQLLPILQEMYLIEQEYEEIKMWNTLLQDLSIDLSQQVTTSPNSTSPNNIRGLLAFIGNSVLDITPGMPTTTIMIKTGAKVFESFEKTQKIKDELKLKMSDIKKKYIEYLENYIPVYNKYMQEWNQICIIKDQAYLQTYSGLYDAALKTCQEALTLDPNNKEMQLLQCVAMIQSTEQTKDSTLLLPQSTNIEIDTRNTTINNTKLQKADNLLTNYINKYPTYSAPALLLKGIINIKNGNKVQAFAYLDQAAIEYPRQAEHLTDMLSSYRARTYLNKTAEGAYLLSLYQSTMEGFGFFSPNFAKAVLHEQSGDLLLARDEIYNHFFRRSNQTVHDCLLLDMEYCENHLASSFKHLLPENSYLDVIFTRSSKIVGLGNDNNKLKVSIYNRSDKTFENIRLFLCIHYTDMHKTDYHIVRVPTLNRINGNENIELGEVELNYQNKSFNDITRVRAIALTDNTLCWIDNVYNADIATNYNPTITATIAELTASLNMQQRQRYFSSMNASASSISESLKLATSIELENKNNIIKNQTLLHIRLPRIIVMLNPTYILNENILPKENYLQGSIAHLVFNNPPLQKDNQLTIKSVYASYTIHFSEITNNTYSVTSIDIITQ